MKNDQTPLLARKLAHYLELFDDELQQREVALPDRPLSASDPLISKAVCQLSFRVSDAVRRRKP